MARTAALPGLFVVALILIGILSGIFTATESAWCDHPRWS